MKLLTLCGTPAHSDGCVSQLKTYTILLLLSFGGVGGTSSVFFLAKETPTPTPTAKTTTKVTATAMIIFLFAASVLFKLG